MALFTIGAGTTASLDSLSPRDIADTYGISGGKLIINTDCRYSKGSSISGILGNVTISSISGGELYIDATKVRYLWYKTGSGNYPPAGSIITQGTGISGEVMNCGKDFATVTSISGSGVNPTGWIKFKGVTGAFVADVGITGVGITAVATTVDKVGWLEVVGITGGVLNIPRLGVFRTRGNWFDVDTTNGLSGQTVQIPIGSGGVNTRFPGLWIEKSVSSEIYEFWPALNTVANCGWQTRNMGYNEICKFVQDAGSGVMRIGSSGGAEKIGYVPEKFLKIRVPNIFVHSSRGAALLGENTVPEATIANRYEITTSNAGIQDIQHVFGEWYWLFVQPYSLDMRYSAVFDQINIQECATKFNLYDVHNGIYSPLDIPGIYVYSCFAGGNITNCTFGRAGAIAATDYAQTYLYTYNLILSGCKSYAATWRTAAAVGTINMTYCKDIEIYNQKNLQSPLQIYTCNNVTVSGFDYTDTLTGLTNATSPQYGIYVYNFSNNVLLDTITFGNNSLTGLVPYSGLLNFSISNNITLRNIGTRQNPVNWTMTAAAVAVETTGQCDGLKFQRIYIDNTRGTLPFTITNVNKNVTYESVMLDATDTFLLTSLNTIFKGCKGTWPTPGQTAIYGTHWGDFFYQPTSGTIAWYANEPVASTSAYYTAISGAPAFTSVGTLYMPSVNDTVVMEMPYYTLGHTEFGQRAPAMSGGTITNYNIYYDIDKGSGFRNSWSACRVTGQNMTLSAETISASGFKLKFKMQTISANSTAISMFQVFTVSTTAAQAANLYPLETIDTSLVLNGLALSSEIRIFNAGTTTEIGSGVEDSLSSYTYNYTWTGTDIPVDIIVHNINYNYLRFDGQTLGRNGLTIPVQQTADRWFSNL